MFLLKIYFYWLKKKKVKSTQHFLCVHEQKVSQRWLRNSKILKKDLSFRFSLLFFRLLWKVAIWVRNQVNLIFHQLGKLGNCRERSQSHSPAAGRTAVFWKHATLTVRKLTKIYQNMSYKL